VVKRKWPISNDEIGRVKGRKQRSRRKYETQDFEPSDHLLYQTALRKKNRTIVRIFNDVVGGAVDARKRLEIVPS